MPSQQQLDNLHAVVPAAQFCAQAYGVPASVTLAQWIVESSWGMSELAVKANNCFGVKHNQRAAIETYIEMPTHEYANGVRTLIEAQFVKYVSVRDSFMGHAKLLASAARYKPAMAVASDPAAFAMELQRCGYSTNPSYGNELIELIHAEGLAQYDAPPPDEPAVQLKEAA